MSILGVGPILAIAGGIILFVILLLQQVFGASLSLPDSLQQPIHIIGILSIVVGLLFYISSARLLFRAFPAHRLETSGAFRFTRNPLYAAFILLIVPGIAFLTNNLLVLLVSIVLFVVFKRTIGREEEYLRREFGREFEEYCHKVPQLVPFIKV
jgi:protein-S-isoprenylcysteine O-methyltransferase Ste14